MEDRKAPEFATTTFRAEAARHSLGVEWTPNGAIGAIGTGILILIEVVESL